MYKIVLTGGPCAGKTSALKGIRDYFSGRGYQVFIVPETATQLFMAGLSPELIGAVHFQRSIIDIQCKIEEVFYRAASFFENSLVIFDRGLADGMAFTAPEEWGEILEQCSIDEQDIFDRYDAVIHLNSVATTMPELYSNETNLIRRESAESAAANDAMIMDSWKGHPNFCVVYNAPEFYQKLNTIIQIIKHLMEQKDADKR